MLTLPADVFTFYGDNLLIAKLRCTCKQLSSLTLVQARIDYFRAGDGIGSRYICGRFEASMGRYLERGRVVGFGVGMTESTLGLGGNEVMVVHDPNNVWNVDPATYRYIRTAIFGDIPQPRISMVKFIGCKRVLGDCITQSHGEYRYFGLKQEGYLMGFTSPLSPEHPAWRTLGYVWSIRAV